MFGITLHSTLIPNYLLFHWIQCCDSMALMVRFSQFVPCPSIICFQWINCENLMFRPVLRSALKLWSWPHLPCFFSISCPIPVVSTTAGCIHNYWIYLSFSHLDIFFIDDSMRLFVHFFHMIFFGVFQIFRSDNSFRWWALRHRTYPCSKSCTCTC